MDIASSRYVSLTTFRKSGEAVPVPVWIAPLPDGRAAFTTDAASGKAKRIRNNPTVTVRPCDMRGKVADDAPEVRATAAIVTSGADLDAAVAAVRKKYGIQFLLIDVGGKLKRLIGRSQEPAAGVIITFDS